MLALSVTVVSLVSAVTLVRMDTPLQRPPTKDAVDRPIPPDARC
jgi:hypothetical protein